MIRRPPRLAAKRVARGSALAAWLATRLAPSLALAATAASAGPNANGTLILHSVSIDDLPPQCTNTYWECDCAPVLECEDADVQAANSYSYEIWWVYAAFPRSSTPRVAEVAFGIRFPEDWLTVGEGADCATTRQPTTGFPNTSGSGTVLTFETPLTAQLAPLCVFQGYTYFPTDPGKVELALTPHPTVGGYFLDDSSPPEVDPIADYGRLGFGEHVGYLPCPMLPVPTEATTWGGVKQKFKETE